MARGALPCARGSSKGPTCRTQCRGHGPLPSGGGRVPGGSPFPGSIIHWPRPEKAWREGHVRLGVPRGVLLLSKTLNLTSDRDSPERHGLTPTVQAMDARALAGKPHFQGLSGGQSRLPGTRGSPGPSPAGCPLRDLSGGGRKAQAGGPEGWLAGPGLRRGPPVTPARTTVAESRFCGAAVTWGVPFIWGKWVCPCRSPTRRRCTAQWFGGVGGVVTG